VWKRKKGGGSWGEARAHDWEKKKKKKKTTEEPAHPQPSRTPLAKPAREDVLSQKRERKDAVGKKAQSQAKERFHHIKGSVSRL